MNIVNWRYKPVSFLNRMPNILDNATYNVNDKEVYNNEWQPLVDIKENSKSYILVADMPGVKKSNIEAKVEENILIIKGDKKLDNEEDNDDYHYSERKVGKFARSFKLPQSIIEDRYQQILKMGLLLLQYLKQKKKTK